MPQIAPAIIAALITAGTAGATTGLELSGALNPSAPKQPNAPAVNPQLQQTQKAAVSQQLPTLQSQVGGSVSPEYYLQMAQLNSGTANQPGSSASAWDAISQYFGLGKPGLTTTTGSASGGLTASPAASHGGGDIVSAGLDDLMSQVGLGGSNKQQSLTA